MARKVTYHSKYKGVIVNKTDISKIRANLQVKMKDLVALLVEQLSSIGEECVKIAREQGDYGTITGNLRSSIGYVVLVDGKPAFYGQSKQYKGKSGDGSAGVAACDALLQQLQGKYPAGVVLIVCAGMDYAAYVEGVHGKKVLVMAEEERDRLARSLLKGLIEDAK